METATHLELLIAIIGAVATIITSFVVGTWVLANRIASIQTAFSENLAAHVGEAKVRDEKISEIRKDVDDHEIRLRTVETGEALREFVLAARSMTEVSR